MTPPKPSRPAKQHLDIEGVESTADRLDDASRSPVTKKGNEKARLRERARDRAALD